MLDVRTKQRVHQVLLPTFSGFDGPSLAWSDDEAKFYLRGFESNSPACCGDSVGHDLEDCITRKHEWHRPIALFWPCREGRLVRIRRLGPVLHNQDSCGKLQVWTEIGLGSGLRITREDQDRNCRRSCICTSTPGYCITRTLLLW